VSGKVLCMTHNVLVEWIDGKVAWNDLKMEFSGGTEDQGLSGFSSRTEHEVLQVATVFDVTSTYSEAHFTGIRTQTSRNDLGEFASHENAGLVAGH